MTEDLTPEHLLRAIAALEAQRPTLGEAVVELALAPLRDRLAALQASQEQEFPEEGEERHLLTVLFADLSGFTSISEQMDAEDVRDLIHPLWVRLDQVIVDYQGLVDKHMGDSLLAVWGIKQSREDDPQQALRAALAVQQECQVFCQEQNIDPGLELHIGLNTGLVSVSYLPSGERNMVGDAVNLAERLQRVAPPGQVLIGKSTYDLVRGLFETSLLPPLEVKGKAEVVQAYRVLGEKQRAFSLQTRGLAGVITQFVGREIELGALQAAYLQAADGGGLQWITVTGEAGVGKTRLLNEFEGWLEGREEQRCYLKGRAWPQTQHSPFFLLRDVLSFHFDIRDSDPLNAARERLAAGLGRELGGELGEEAAALIGQWMGLDFSHSPWIEALGGDPQQMRGRAGVLLRQYLSQLCAGRIVLLLLEDLHWADDETLHWLAETLAEAPAWRMCVIGLARRQFWEGWQHWGQNPIGDALLYHRRLDLLPLSAEPARALIGELLQKVNEPPAWLVDLLVEIGAGNPYFTEELVYFMIEQGTIEMGPEGWKVSAANLEEIHVPWSVQEVLHARINRLSPGQRVALQRAAAIGRVFWESAVAYVGREATPPENWERLQSAGLVLRQAVSQLPDETEYHFKHALLQEVVYEYTLIKLRRSYHRRVAEWLIQASEARADEWAAVIARHYEKSGATAFCAEWYGRAGAQALAKYALDAAIRYYQQALAFLPEQETSLPQQVIFNEHLARALRWRSRYLDAIEICHRMRAAAEQAGDLAAQGRAWDELAWLHEALGDTTASLECATQAENFARQSQSPVEFARALFHQGWAYFRLGDLQRGRELGERALEMCDTQNISGERGYCLNLLGAVWMELGNTGQALQCMQAAMEHFRSVGNRRAVAVMLGNIGEVVQKAGKWQAALENYQQALALLRELGMRDIELADLSNIGAVCVELGRYGEAEAVLRQVIETASLTNPGAYYLAHTCSALARACLGGGKEAEALAAAQRALELSQQNKNPEYIGEAWRTMGMVLSQEAFGQDEQLRRAAAGESAAGLDAAGCFVESLKVFDPMNAEGEKARTLREWAKHELRQGDKVKGQALRQQAEEIFARLGTLAGE